MTVTGLTDAGTLREVVSVSGFARLSQGNDLTGLVQDVSAATDLVSGITGYESELTRTTGLVASPFATAGSAFESATLTTAGVMGDANLKLRLPAAITDAMDLAQGCSLTVTAPMWRFDAVAQVSGWASADLSAITCPAPQVVSASGSQGVKANVGFDRVIDPTSILADGSQFTIPPLTVSSAAVTAPRQVTIATTAQQPGTVYTLTVAASVHDLYGNGPVAPMNTATFSGPTTCAPSQVVLSQIFPGGGNSGAPYNADFIELHNRSLQPVTLTNWSIQYQSSTGTTWSVVTPLASVTLPAGGYYLVQASNTGTNGVALPTPDLISTFAAGLGATAGKVALVASTTALTACPTGSAAVDLVGYGTSTNVCNETAPTPSPGNANAAVRNSAGCIDTNNNSTDFSVTAPSPRTSHTAANDCNCN